MEYESNMVINVKVLYDYCRRCGRRLRSEKSRSVGYGAICEAKAKADNSRWLFSPGNLGGEHEQKEKPLD